MIKVYKSIVLFALIMMSLTAHAAFTAGGLTYEVTSASTAMVAPRWPAYSGDINVPKTVKHDGVTYTVTAIAAKAFMNAEFLTSITLHSSLVEIGANAFENCSKIKSVKVPNTVTSIGARAFAGCTSLSTITLSTALTEVPNGMLDGCASLREVVVPDKVTRISSYAFSRSSLEKITIGKRVNAIERLAFEGCTKMKVVHIKDLSAWCKIDFATVSDNPLRVARALVLNGDTLRYLKIPDGITHIKPFSFVGINSFSVEFPSTLRSIDLSAFIECYFVKSLVIPNSVTELTTENMGSGMYTFPNVERIVVGSGLRAIPNSAFYFCYSLKNLLLLDGVEEIGYDAFKFGHFESLVMPSTLRTLSSSFASCEQLKSVTLNYNLRKIEGGAFYQCKNLAELHCLMPDPNNVEFTGGNHFEGVNTKICTLFVPAESVKKYKNHPMWSAFRHILPDIPMPDVNRNGLVDVDDVNMIVNSLLEIEAPGCSRTAADVNHDGLIDVDDVNCVINRVLGLE